MRADRQRYHQTAPAVEHRIALDDKTIVLSLAEQPGNIRMCVTTEARAPVLLVVALRTIGVITESPDIETHLLTRSVVTAIAKFSADRAGDRARRRVPGISIFSKRLRRNRRQYQPQQPAQPY